MSQLVWLGFTVVLVAGISLFQIVFERRRKAAYADYAVIHGLSFDPECKDLQTRLGNGFELFNRGGLQTFRYALSGTRAGVPFTAFEFRYPAGRSTRSTSVMLWERPQGTWPGFAVAPEDLGDKILQLFGTQDFDFPEDKAFSGDYRLQGSDEAAVRGLFGPATRAFCLAHPGMYAAAHERHLIWWRQQALPDPQGLDQFFTEGDAFRQLFF